MRCVATIDIWNMPKPFNGLGMFHVNYRNPLRFGVRLCLASRFEGCFVLVHAFIGGMEDGGVFCSGRIES